MSVDFFSYAESVVPCKIFGICDKGKNTPAYIDTENENDWIAKVACNNRSDYKFIAVDNNISYLDRKGNNKRRCDAMLYTEKTICFIELKNKDSDWVTSCLEQLGSTIALFTENHNIYKFKLKRAFACNKRRPNFQKSYKRTQQEFYNKYKITLRIKNDIPELDIVK